MEKWSQSSFNTRFFIRNLGFGFRGHPYVTIRTDRGRWVKCRSYAIVRGGRESDRLPIRSDYQRLDVN